MTISNYDKTTGDKTEVWLYISPMQTLLKKKMVPRFMIYVSLSMFYMVKYIIDFEPLSVIKKYSVKKMFDTTRFKYIVFSNMLSTGLVLYGRIWKDTLDGYGIIIRITI